NQKTPSPKQNSSARHASHPCALRSNQKQNQLNRK
ncbi:hypothetical protein A2U01_0107381, partial [Trifolium medium]|nr:hypothetical protein [Trifolium medium]